MHTFALLLLGQKLFTTPCSCYRVFQLQAAEDVLQLQEAAAPCSPTGAAPLRPQTEAANDIRPS